jgi:hypothetical protein
MMRRSVTSMVRTRRPPACGLRPNEDRPRRPPIGIGPTTEAGQLWRGMIAHVQPEWSLLTGIQSPLCFLGRFGLIAARLYELFDVCRHSRDEPIRRERSGMLYEPGRLEL